MKALLLSLLLFAVCCQGQEPVPILAAPPPATPSKLPPDTVAVVDGHAIAESEVRAALRLKDPETPIDPAQGRAATELLIQQELVAQRAAAMGLDHSAQYQRGLRELQAQVDAYRRTALGEAYFAAMALTEAQITDQELAAYFAVNGAQWRSEFHVLQLFTRDKAEADKLLAAVRGGVPFAQAYRDLNPKLPQNETPWDLGWLRWQQLPVQWQGVVDKLAAGATTDVLAGPNGRYWVVQLVNRRDDPTATLQAIKPALLQYLRGQKAEAARTALPDALLKRAQIQRIAYP